MKQGVLQNTRVRLLLSAGHSCYRPRRKGERVRKSVRGCIVGPDIAVLALAIVKQGDNDIPGLTDQVLPKRLGPKRATKVSRIPRSEGVQPERASSYVSLQPLTQYFMTRRSADSSTSQRRTMSASSSSDVK